MLFTIHIGARAPDDTFPLHIAALAGDLYESLVFPPLLLERAAALLRPGSPLPTSDEAALGIFLARQVFTPTIRSLLMRSANQARQANTPLRLLLQIDPPELAALPWEWMTIAGRSHWSPALLDDYGLVRIPGFDAERYRAEANIADSPFALPRSLRQPLRLLLAAPDTEDATLRQVRGALHELVRARRVQLAVEPVATPQELQQAVRRQRPHVLHLFGAVDFIARGRARLRLDNGQELDAAGLVALLRAQTASLLPRRSALPALVIEGAAAYAGRLTSAPPHLALEATRHGLPACIAFHSPLYPAESALFAGALYAALVKGDGIDEATTAGRRALNEGGAGDVWGMPMLAARYGDPAERAGVRLARRTANEPPAGRPGRRSPRLTVLAPLAATGVGLLLAINLFTGPRDAQPDPSSADRDGRVALHASTPTTALLSAPAGTPDPLAPPFSPPAPTVAPTPLPPLIGWATCLVAPGDTVTTIAERMGSDPQSLATINRVAVEDPLVVGRALAVPVYRPGEPGVGGLDVNVGRQDRPEVALTFDIEIDDTMLYQYLDILGRRGVRATFFVTGAWVSAYPDAARAIVAGGHEIANHSFSHPSFNQIGADGAIRELQATEDMVVQTTGASTRPFFRFPYGAKNPAILQVIAGQGYISYHWTADDNALPYWLQSVAAGQVNPNGAILLLHQRTSSVAALPGWLDQLAALGLTPTSLGRVLR